MGICSSTGCTRIPCGKMAGTYGCFMKLSEDVKRRLLEDNVKNYSVYAGTDREANLNVDGTLMTNLIKLSACFLLILSSKGQLNILTYSDLFDAWIA